MKYLFTVMLLMVLASSCTSPRYWTIHPESNQPVLIYDKYGIINQAERMGNVDSITLSLSLYHNYYFPDSYPVEAEESIRVPLKSITK